MTYKSLRKITSATKYRVTVFDTDGNFYDDFEIDYTGEKEKLDNGIIKSFSYEKCQVRNISTYKDFLEISLTKK